MMAEHVLKDTGTLPWHEQSWRRLMASRHSNRLPHALLLSGPVGLGKSHFAHQLARTLLCERSSQEDSPCGACHSCRLMETQAHPDFTLITPEEPGKAIKIDTVREFTDRGALTSQSGGFKVVILEPADALNTAAANSLLKTLEEPVDRTVIILVTARPGTLPATIRSRCQRYHFAPPDERSATAWLQGRSDHVKSDDIPLLLSLASGAPLLALLYAEDGTLEERRTMIKEILALQQGKEDPVRVAQRWSQLAQRDVVLWFSGWVIDIVRLKIASQTADIINIDQRECLQALARKVNSRKVYALFDRLVEANRTQGSQLNTQMQLESLLLDWAELGEE